MKNIISTNKAPKAIGPYSQAVEANGIVFVSGQLPINPQDGSIPQTVEKQTEIVIKNIQAILSSVGLTLENVVKTTVFMTDLTKFNEMNEVYSKFFSSNPPARATVEVKNLPKGVMVEIEAIAVK
jgi:2-iminobutanoate/2-iminopropanoate deaminase